MILFFHCSNLRRRLPFYTAIIQFWTTNQEQPKSTCAQSNRETEKQRDFKGSWLLIKQTQQELGNFATTDRHFMEPHRVNQQNLVFCVSNSYSTVIFERFSYHPDRKFRSTSDFSSTSQKTSLFSSVPKFTFLKLRIFVRICLRGICSSCWK